MRFLGDDLATIADAKAGILRPGVPAVIGWPPAAARHAAEAAKLGAPLFRHGAEWAVAAASSTENRGGFRFTWHDQPMIYRRWPAATSISTPAPPSPPMSSTRYRPATGHADLRPAAVAEARQAGPDDCKTVPRTSHRGLAGGRGSLARWRP